MLQYDRWVHNPATYQKSYPERQVSCGTAEQRSLFDFLSLFNFVTPPPAWFDFRRYSEIRKALG